MDQIWKREIDGVAKDALLGLWPILEMEKRYHSTESSGCQEIRFVVSINMNL